MKFYLYPRINLENHAMPPPKLANSVDPLAAASLYHPSDNNTHFLFAFKVTNQFIPLNMLVV